MVSPIDFRAPLPILRVPPRSPQTLQVEGLFKAANRHVKLLEFDSHGYSVIDVTSDRLQADWHYVADPTDVTATSRFASGVQVMSGINLVTPAAGPLGQRV